MPELAFVDTHVHYWDLEDPKLHYLWLQPGWVHPLLGDIRALKAPLYGAEEFIAETRFANVPKAVHVQAALGIEDADEETKWVHAAAERAGYPLGIVAYTNLKGADARAEIERHLAASSRMRGIRDFSDGDYLVDDEFARGYALLAEYDLVLELDCLWENMGKAGALANRHPGVTMVLDHTGFPQERDDAYFRNWQAGMTTLASAPSVVCKISGLAMRDPNWTVASIRPWVLHAIEAFGIERCFFGTNWPVDRLYSCYRDVIDAYAEIVADFSPDEQRALFAGNAERVYRL